MRFGVVPSSVRRDVLNWHGESGRAWLDDLPRTVWSLKRTWSLRMDGPPYDGGSHSYVVPVRREDDSPAVLKVIYLDDENRGEPTALHRYQGDGAVELYDYDAATGAMLMEKAVPGNRLKSTRFFGHKTPAAAWRRIGIATGLYRRLWRPYEPAEGFPDLPAATEMLDAWRAEYREPDADVRRRLGDDRLREALARCDDLADAPETGIGNRDTHLTNIVSAEREPWLVIDPKPYLAERAFDGGYFLFTQELYGPHSGRDLLRAVADGLGADAERVKAWALLRFAAHLAHDADERELDEVSKAMRELEDA